VLPLLPRAAACCRVLLGGVSDEEPAEGRAPKAEPITSAMEGVCGVEASGQEAGLHRVEVQGRGHLELRETGYYMYMRDGS